MSEEVKFQVVEVALNAPTFEESETGWIVPVPLGYHLVPTGADILIRDLVEMNVKPNGALGTTCRLETIMGEDSSSFEWWCMVLDRDIGMTSHGRGATMEEAIADAMIHYNLHLHMWAERGIVDEN